MQSLFMRFCGKSQQATVFQRRFGVVNGAGADDDQQTVIAAVDYFLGGLARINDVSGDGVANGISSSTFAVPAIRACF